MPLNIDTILRICAHTYCAACTQVYTISYEQTQLHQKIQVPKNSKGNLNKYLNIHFMLANALDLMPNLSLLDHGLYFSRI
jgi:hypothetical protein